MIPMLYIATAMKSVQNFKVSYVAIVFDLMPASVLVITALKNSPGEYEAFMALQSLLHGPMITLKL